MALARPLRKAANRLLSRLGTSCTLTRTVATVDPVAGTSTDVETAFAWKVVVEAYEDALVDGSNILASDRKLTGAASALSVSPSPVVTVDNVTTSYRVTVAGESFQVHNVKPTYAEDSVVLWTIQGRR